MPNFQANLTNLKRIVFPLLALLWYVCVCAPLSERMSVGVRVCACVLGCECGRTKPNVCAKSKVPMASQCVCVCMRCTRVSECLFALHLCTCVQTEEGRASWRRSSSSSSGVSRVDDAVIAFRTLTNEQSTRNCASVCLCACVCVGVCGRVCRLHGPSRCYESAVAVTLPAALAALLEPILQCAASTNNEAGPKCAKLQPRHAVRSVEKGERQAARETQELVHSSSRVPSPSTSLPGTR